MLNGFLKQSTASQSRLVGPFIDDTDFKTPETGLTINASDVKLSKNGAASVNKNSGGGTHRINGKYSLTFDATDTNTVGELDYSISVSGALVVTGKFVVLEEAIYDALFGASANGFDSSGQVTVGTMASNVITASSIAANAIGSSELASNAIGADQIASNAITAAKIAASALDGKGDWNIGKTGYSLSASGVDAIWDETQSGHTTVGTFGYYLDARVSDAGGGGGTDWTAGEREQIRDALGVTGTKTAATGGQLQNKLEPTTAGRTLDVAANNAAKIDFDLAAGTIDANQIGNNAITAAKIAASALDGKGDWNIGKTGYSVNTVNDKSGYSLAADQSGVTIGTVTTNTDMRGTDNALLASSAPANFGDLAITVTTGYVTAGTVNDKTGYSLSASGNEAVHDAGDIDGRSMEEATRLIAASVAGKLSGVENGLPVFKGINNSAKDRISAVTDEDGNRLNVNEDVTP